MNNQQQAVLDPTTPFYADTDLNGFQDSLENHPMAELLNEFGVDDVMEPQTGEIRQGTIVDKRENELLVDIGFKSEGIVAGREIDRIRDILDTLEVGDEVPVYVLREDRDGNIMLSIARAQAEKDWQRAEELLESQEIFEGVVSGYNRGGVIIKLGQVRGFVPASQLSNESQRMQIEDVEPDERWANLMDKTMYVKVIDLERRRNRLILSERQAMRERRREQKEKLLASLEEGAICEGVVSSLADFGAFVNLGGADGLIHLSELSWNRVRHPSEVVEIGQKVRVQVLSVDLERKRIGLSLRRLQPEPWELVPERYSVGQIVRGTITKLVNFGAFARLEEDGIEGLIHISELAHHRISHPREVVAEGEQHDLRIIRIDTAKRRMGLSLKQALPEEETVEVDWQPVPLEENPEAAADVEEAPEPVAEVPEPTPEMEAIPEAAVEAAAEAEEAVASE